MLQGHRHPHRRAATWLALLLWVLATLAPTVSRAMAHVQGEVAPWAQVCSTTPANTTPEGGALAQHLMDHCPMCALQAGHAMAPPPVASAALPTLALSQAMPPLWLHAPSPLFAWASAQPRAPPHQA